MLTDGEGPEARHQLGEGRIAAVNPAAFNTTDFVTRLLDAIHWLSPSIAD